MKKFEILMDIDLIKCLPDGSKVDSFYGPLLISQEDEETILVDFQSGFQLNTLFDRLVVRLSSCELSDLLESWYSKNRLLKIHTSSNVSNVERNYCWLSERLKVGGSSELTYLIREPNYKSMIFSGHYLSNPMFFGGYHSNFALLMDITKISIPNEEDIEYFKEYYTSAPNLNRPITP